MLLLFIVSKFLTSSLRMKYNTESELTNTIKEHLQVNLELSNIKSSYSITLDALTMFFLAHFVLWWE